jgi:uncharacterized protein
MAADRQRTNLSVTGTGKVQVAPDEAIVHLSVVTDGRTAAEAVAANARQTQAVITAVSAQPNHGVTTSGLSVYPIMSYEPNTSVGTIVGFRATNGVEVMTKPGYVGQIYDAGIAAGATQSSGITFRVQDEGPHREVALRLAIEEAVREAKIVAAAANIALGEVESIQVEPGDGRVFFRSEMLDAKQMTTPVIPERQMITARVHVQFGTRDQLDVRPGPGKLDRDGKDVKARSPGSA